MITLVKRPSEIEGMWESAVITEFNNSIDIPSDAAWSVQLIPA